MRELVRWGVQAVVAIVLLGAIWPWVAPAYSRAVAALTDTIFFILHQPFGAQHVSAHEIELSWQPLRYTSFDRLQEQMGYVDRFARRGLEGHRLMTVNALYMQAGILVVLALVWTLRGLAPSQRGRRTIAALGALMVLQALNLVISAHIEFQLRLRYLSTSGALVILEDPEWYLYYGVRPVPVVLNYVLPWLVGLTYRVRARRGDTV